MADSLFIENNKNSHPRLGDSHRHILKYPSVGNAAVNGDANLKYFLEDTVRSLYAKFSKDHVGQASGFPFLHPSLVAGSSINVVSVPLGDNIPAASMDEVHVEILPEFHEVHVVEPSAPPVSDIEVHVIGIGGSNMNVVSVPLGDNIYAAAVDEDYVEILSEAPPVIVGVDSFKFESNEVHVGKPSAPPISDIEYHVIGTPKVGALLNAEATVSGTHKDGGGDDPTILVQKKSIFNGGVGCAASFRGCFNFNFKFGWKKGKDTSFSSTK